VVREGIVGYVSVEHIRGVYVVLFCAEIKDTEVVLMHGLEVSLHFGAAVSIHGFKANSGIADRNDSRGYIC